MSNQSTLGSRIKQHRKRLGLTQEQLAERMGVSPQAVSKWENDLSCPDISALPELAAIFGISVDALLGQEPRAAEVVEEAPRKEGFSFHWEDRRGKRYYSIVFAVFALLFGGLWLMNLGLHLDVSWWTLLWTLFLVFLGVCGLRVRFSAASVVLMLAGSYFLLSAYGLLGLSLGWQVVVPVCIIAGGISLLIDGIRGKNLHKSKEYYNERAARIEKIPQMEFDCREGQLRCEMAFGDYAPVVRTPCLRGGEIEGSFGDFSVDFSGVEQLAPECALSVSCHFGDLTLLLPKRFAVKIEERETFAASIAVKGTPAQEPEGTLLLRAAEAHLGEICVQYIER